MGQTAVDNERCSILEPTAIGPTEHRVSRLAFKHISSILKQLQPNLRQVQTAFSHISGMFSELQTDFRTSHSAVAAAAPEEQQSRGRDEHGAGGRGGETKVAWRRRRWRGDATFAASTVQLISAAAQVAANITHGLL